MKHHSVPGADFANADEALGHLARPGCVVHVASAFVTAGGAGRLIEHFGGVASSISLAARAAEVTDPDALLWLQQEGVSVSIVIGKGASRFHPKLFLVDDPAAGELSVLSGSGNLTGGGLSSNTEQFELVTFTRSSARATEQFERFTALTSAAFPLVELQGTAVWGAWLAARAFASRAPGLHDVRKRWTQLDQLEVKLSRDADREALLDDLFSLYERTVAAKLPRADGQPYRPNRFYGALLRIQDGEGEPVTLVRKICSHQTGGFDVILKHGDRSLTVEALVVDESKPYHDLFGEQTRLMSEARLAQFAD